MSKRPKISPAEQDSIDRFLAVVLPRFPTLDPTAEAAVDRMTRIVKHLDKVSGRISARFGINVGEFKVLLKLDRHGAMTAGELADVLSLSSGAMTNRLDGLEEAGFLTRTRDPEDRRSVLVDVTPAGRELLEKVVETQGAEERDLLAVLSPEDRDRLNDLLRSLVRSIDGDLPDP
jgi:DNA-binding MarR family transcriptional regulator